MPLDMKDHEIKFVPGGRWAIAHVIDGKTIDFVQRTPVTNEEDIIIALDAMGFSTHPELIKHWFPKNSEGKRYPSFAFLEFWMRFKYQGVDTTTPGV